LANPIRPYEPPIQFVDPKTGALTRRADSFLRDWFRFTGAENGVIPVDSLDGDGVNTATFLREDGTWAIPDYPIGANPTASVGETVVNGVAVTFMRSDASPPLDLTITPTWTGAHVFTSSVTADSLVATNGFGCNGKTAQTEVTVNAAVSGTAGAAYTGTEQTMINDLKALVNQIRAALIADGVLV
jgi:hypothetical protein